MGSQVSKHRLWIDGRWEDGASQAELHSPYSGETVAVAGLADAKQMERALTAARKAFEDMRGLSRYARSRLLTEIARGIGERREELTEAIVREAGKPWSLSDAEVGRAITTFTVASEEAKRFGGEVVPVDIEASGRAYSPAVAYWVPRGPVLAITPFNFPLNLVAHKVAPALAVGTSVLLKPPPQAPGASRILAEIFEKAAAAASDARERIPLAALQVLSCPNDVAEIAVSDPRMAVLSFTGSDKVGWMLQKKATGKRVLLELGGNAAVIVHKDADLSRAAARCAFGSFAYAGQVCISVQRIFVQKDVAEKFQELLIAETRKVGIGDPAKKETIVGPLIDQRAGDRLMEWIEEAKRSGAKVVLGGTRNGNVMQPTVLRDVPRSARLHSEEAFGPVVALETYGEFSEAIDAVNRSRYGLQAGVFTDSSKLVREAVEKLEVGGIMINEAPTYRADNMPYGGVKESGLGREGVRYAMEEFCDRRTVVSWQG